MSINGEMVNEIMVQLHYGTLCSPPKESIPELMDLKHFICIVSFNSHNYPMKFPFHR